MKEIYKREEEIMKNLDKLEGKMKYLEEEWYDDEEEEKKGVENAQENHDLWQEYEAIMEEWASKSGSEGEEDKRESHLILGRTWPVEEKKQQNKVRMRKSESEFTDGRMDQQEVLVKQDIKKECPLRGKDVEGRHKEVESLMYSYNDEVDMKYSGRHIEV